MWTRNTLLWLLLWREVKSQTISTNYYNKLEKIANSTIAIRGKHAVDIRKSIIDEKLPFCLICPVTIIKDGNNK